MTENTQHQQHHIVPVKVYLAVFGALLVLTGVTVAVAKLDLGILNVTVALAVAICKTTLVVLFFMHVKYSHHVVKVYVAAGFLFLVIMLGITLADYMTRSWIATPRGWAPPI